MRYYGTYFIKFKISVSFMKLLKRSHKTPIVFEVLIKEEAKTVKTENFLIDSCFHGNFECKI